jgi:hypothetical protein
MGELTARILRKIDDAKDFDDIKDWIWMAGDLLRLAASPGFHSGFEEIDREVVSDDERKALQEAALTALIRNPEPMWEASFLSVLRDAHDASLLPLWIEYLTKYQSLLKQSNAIVFTILLALKELQEPIFAKAQSLNSIDVERNLREADLYLLGRGIKTPW